MRRVPLSSAAAALLAALISPDCAPRADPQVAPARSVSQPAGGQSQPASSRLAARLRPGVALRITTADRRIEGVLDSIDRDGLTIRTPDGRETLSCVPIDRVERRGDSVLTGAVIGAAVIALPAWNGCQNQGRNLACVAVGVGTFAALGALIDRAHAGWATVYVKSPGSCGTP
jgi:hypothetical protein